jgi:HKD family nuclease
MRFLDFTSLFDTEPANLAILSTFQLDADFFEQRLLHCPALVKARRILIFMDAGQWLCMLRQDVRARLLNRRYLVVPVRPSRGVFHPKVNLQVSEQGGHVQCGSNNLTRSGCSSNLELLNSFSFNLEGDGRETIYIVQEAYKFFKRACDDAEEETGRIARQWLEELAETAPWIAAPLPQDDHRNVRFMHTYEGSLWDRLTIILDDSPPEKLMVISPFYDMDGEMVKRVHRHWPKCKIELIVQQKYTNLPVSLLKKFRSKVVLSELRNSSRRLHAKLMAWESKNGTGCLVGSANFTTAAYDAKNIETCLLVSEAEDLVRGLFDKQLGKRPITFEDFEPGPEQEPEPIDGNSTSLRLASALLTADGQLHLTYQHHLKSKPSSLRLAIRTPEEQRPRALINLPNKEKGTATVTPTEAALADVHGTILASLVAEVEGHREESPPVWVIQEGRLTYEPSGERSSSRTSKVEETGEGLTELLEEIGNRGGVAAIIEYLRHLNIRFYDGGSGSGHRRSRLRIHDPFHPDVAPEWLLKTDTDDLSTALSEFVDRHEKQRLQRHAKRGNINGMENFLDIFTTLIRLLYVYYLRGVINRHMLIGHFCNYLYVATSGIESDDDHSEGYLYTLYENLGRDTNYLQEVCNDLNFLGHLRAALLIVQKVRFVPGEQTTWGPSPKCPSDCLPSIRDKVNGTINELGLDEPSKQEVMKAMAEYKMFSPEGLAEFEKEIVS